MPVRRKRQTAKECLGRLGLRINPFIERYPIEEKLWALDEELLEDLKDYLDECVSTGEMFNLFLWGNYGTGKTYALKTLSYYIKAEHDGLGIYIQLPSKYDQRGFRDIYSLILHAIGTDVIEKALSETCKDESLADEESFKEYFSKFTQNPNLIGALYNIAFGNEKAVTWLWLTGTASIHQQRALGFEVSLRDEYWAVEFLASIMAYMAEKFGLLILFVDELENLIGSSRAIRSCRDGFRGLYDKMVYEYQNTKFGLVSVASATYYYEVVRLLDKALRDRFDEEFQMNKLTEDEAIDFVVGLLDWARTEDTENTFHPFKNKTAIREMVNSIIDVTPKDTSNLVESGLTLRRIIKKGRLLLRRVCRKRLDEISTKDVKSLLRR